MNYVEWLRVRNVLIVLAAILVLGIAGGLILRISVNKYLSYNTYIDQIQKDPHTTAVPTTGPDGASRLVIDNPVKHMHAVVDDYGFRGKRIVVTEPIGRSHTDVEHATIGSISVDETTDGKNSITTIETNHAVPMLYYMLVADVVALIVATILSAPFARESDGHLEIAATKPVSREAFALGTILADGAGIAASAAMTVIALVVVQAMFEFPTMDLSGVNGEAMIMGVALPIAWYAMLNAATASLKRGYGAVLGFAWPICLVVGALAAMHAGDNPVLNAVKNVFWVISRAIPLSYVSLRASTIATQTSNPHVDNPTFLVRLGIELLLFVVYSALAIVQWRRVEA